MNYNFEKYIVTLQNNPLFHDIPIMDIPLLLNRLHASIKSYTKNSYIKNSGEPADFIGIVLTGEIHIIQDDYYGNRSIIASVIENEIFGEAFSCANIKQLPVDIIAANDCTILFLNSNILLSSCDGNCSFHHKLINNLLHIIAVKNMMLNQKLTYSSHKTTKEKLLAYLNDMAKQNASDEFTIPFNRQQLADYLGIERSAMSTEITKLAKAGILETQRNHFKLIKTLEHR